MPKLSINQLSIVAVLTFRHSFHIAPILFLVLFFILLSSVFSSILSQCSLLFSLRSIWFHKLNSQQKIWLILSHQILNGGIDMNFFIPPKIIIFFSYFLFVTFFISLMFSISSRKISYIILLKLFTFPQTTPTNDSLLS